MPNPNALVRPRALAPGSRVALIAPAGPLDPERIALSARRCAELGLIAEVYPSAGARHGYLAGTDEQRLADLQTAFDDPDIDAIWALRGGYGTMRLLARLDLARQRRDPIPYIGFSDNTALLVRHHGLGVISFHAPHPGGDFPPESGTSFQRVLFEGDAPGPLITRPHDPTPVTLVGGRVEAPLVGGNLSILASLCGSEDAPRAAGHILFLEDVAEPAYRVDRMLVQLERAGVLEDVTGLAFGRFTEAPDDEHPVIETLREFAERIGVPAVADLPFGHVEHNNTLPVGARAVLSGDDAALVLSEPAVRL